MLFVYYNALEMLNISQVINNHQRDTIDVIYEMLKFAEEPIIRTQMMYKANMSFGMLNKYVDVLVERGLLTYNGRQYIITQRGREFVKHYLMMLDLLVPSAYVHVVENSAVNDA